MNREFRIKSDMAEAATVNAAVTRANLVYERVKTDIIAGELTPGTRLRVDFVCERYKMGSSPVREALTRLAAEGFIRREEKRGFFVAGVSADEFRELTETRCWIEELALRRSIELVSTPDQKCIGVPEQKCISRHGRTAGPGGISGFSIRPWVCRPAEFRQEGCALDACSV